MIGKKLWVFPDGDLPAPGKYKNKGHESIVILNTNEEAAQIAMTLYFEYKEPVADIMLQVEANRVRCLRMDNPQDIGGFKTPLGIQYAIKLESSVPVVVQYGRLDTSDQPMNFYINTGYSE